ncbi:Type I secretion membrane fusion protein, HlyD [Sphingobium indicum BiD32]|uniref:Membrane fusion protein (MFP) family protein n=1 Tax=Sphingobium indicum BiD32 TaxID=1301087 RepID=N1MNA4_9SPHN|nr:HlyD family type I secretion periplasmic adaptor subunit [Sphingobium indicum]CCW18446.1 Type I secretion membrane fusion protein, HlyD [Sphingobium indicum BiD32]
MYYLITDQRPDRPVEQTPAVKLMRSLRHAMLLMGILVIVLGGLAAFLPMASAVIGSGEVTVESRVRQIGHPTGGVIKDLPVREGTHVKKGQLLMALDNRVSSASAAMTGANIDQLEAREARLIAERDGLPAIIFPASLRSRAKDPAVAEIMRVEQRAFAFRRASRGGQEQQVQERIRQTQTQIAGFEDQVISLEKQAALMDDQLAATRMLWEKRYTTLDKLRSLERAAIASHSSAAEARVQAAQARARLSEISQQGISITSDLSGQAGTDLATVQAQLIELRRNNITAMTDDERNAIRAPSDGVVDKIKFTTIGGIVPAGETLIELIPDGDDLEVTARIGIADIDQVSPGQPAMLRFSAFNMRTTPEIAGTVAYVSGDRRTDERNGMPYYVARVQVTRDELKKLGGLKLKPGMPVETFIKTGERSMLSYLVKPLRDQLYRAFRHD